MNTSPPAVARSGGVLSAGIALEGFSHLIVNMRGELSPPGPTGSSPVDDDVLFRRDY